MNHEIVLTEAGDLALVTLSGELDVAAAPFLRSTLVEAIRTTSTGVVVDMSEVTFIDAAVLAVLVGAFARARELPQGLHLARTPLRIFWLLHVVGLDALLCAELSPAPGRPVS